MRPWLIAMLLLTAVLAGCADDPTETTDDTGDGNGDVTDAGNGDGTGNPTGGQGTGADGTSGPNNTAPVASLTADLLNGTAPLGVNFTIDGSDADGDNITWILAINGTDTAQGDTFPASYNHTFGAGEFFVELSVFDGVNATFANVTIHATVAEANDDAVDPAAPQDRGWYIYDPVTELCHVKDYTDIGDAGVLYNAELAPGGDWYIAEDNGVPGLQYADGHPADAAGPLPVVGTPFSLNQADCKGGDVIVL